MPTQIYQPTYKPEQSLSRAGLYSILRRRELSLGLYVTAKQTHLFVEVITYNCCWFRRPP